MSPLGFAVCVPRFSFLVCLALGLTCVSVFVPAPAPAQSVPASAANQDIFKMLQASVPESVIVIKIHEGAGRWDTSVDAIIALKKAGATDAELAALTSAPEPTKQSGVPPSLPEVLGGVVKNQQGVVTFSIPSSQRTGAFVLNFQVVALGDHLGLKLPTEGVLERGRNVYRSQLSLTYGDLIFDRGHIIYYPYIDAGSTYGNPFPTWTATATTQPVVFELAAVSPVYLNRGMDVEPVSEDYASVGSRLYNYRDFWLITNLNSAKPSKEAPQWGFRLGDAYDHSPESANARKAIDLVIHNANSAISQILEAAGASGSNVLLDPRSSFTQPAPAKISAIIAARNAEVTQRYQDYKATNSKAQLMDGGNAGSNGTSGFLTFLSVMQGVTDMAQATRQGTTAAITGNTAAQATAFQQQLAAQTQILNALNNPSATAIQPIAPSDPNLIQATANQQIANIQAKGAQLAAAQSHSTTTTTAQAQSPFRYTPLQPNTGALINPGPTPTVPPPAPNPNANQNQNTITLDVLCPASGLVPGVTYHPGGATGVSTGVPCTPGSVIYINGVAQYKMPDGSTSPGLHAVGGNGQQGAPGAQVPLSAPTGQSCREMDVAIIHLDTKWTNATKSEVVAYFSNDSINDVTCTSAFHKNGQWADYQIGFVPAGAQHLGGEQGGLWDTGNDSSSMMYLCYAGRWPMDANGIYCNANKTFTGQTIAGTDK